MNQTNQTNPVNQTNERALVTTQPQGVTKSWCTSIVDMVRQYGDDITLPRIQLVGANSELVRTYPPGSWVYNRSVQIAQPNEPLTVLVLNIGPKAWSFRGAGNESVLAFSPEEVRLHGGTTSFVEVQRNPQLKYFRPFAPVYLMVELTPEQQARVNSDLMFEGKPYLIGSLTIGGTSFRQVRRLLTERVLGVLHAGWTTRYWSLKGVSRQFRSIWAWVPEFTLAGRPSAELQALASDISQMLGIGAAPQVRSTEPIDLGKVEVEDDQDNVEV